MKKLLSLILFLLLIASVTSPVYGATYYIRADGTAANKAAATGPCGTVGNAMNVTVHNGETFAAGDTIYFCDDGGDFTTPLIVPSSGSVGQVITYAAYTGETVLFDTNTEYNDWEDAADPAPANVWSRTATAQFFYQVFEDDVRLSYRATVAEMTTAGTWAFVSGVAYVRCTDDGNPNTHKIEYGAANPTAIKINGKSYITFDGINVTRPDLHSYNTDLAGSDHLTIKNCTVSWSGKDNILIGRTADGTQTDPTNVTIQNVVAHDDLDVGIWVGYGTGVTVQNCETYNQGLDVSPNGKLHPTSGTYAHYPNGILLRNITNCSIINNYVHDFYANGGILDEYSDAQDAGTGNIIAYNHVVRTYSQTAGSGIRLEGDDTLVHHNIIEVTYDYGIHVLGGVSGQVPDSLGIYNNTIYSAVGADHSVLFTVGTNTSFQNNLIYRNGGTTKRYVSALLAAVTGIDFSNNLYYGAETGLWKYSSENETSTFSTWVTQASDGGAVNADPLLVSATDFHLQAASPAINAGVDVGLPYCGIAPDIGAYEFCIPVILAPSEHGGFGGGFRNP